MELSASLISLLSSLGLSYLHKYSLDLSLANRTGPKKTQPGKPYNSTSSFWFMLWKDWPHSDLVLVLLLLLFLTALWLLTLAMRQGHWSDSTNTAQGPTVQGWENGPQVG